MGPATTRDEIDAVTEALRVEVGRVSLGGGAAVA
jgi:hypothetical protein